MKNTAILIAILVLVGLGVYTVLQIKKKDSKFSDKISKEEFLEKSLADKKIEVFGKYDYTTRWYVVGIVLIITVIIYLFKFLN